MSIRLNQITQKALQLPAASRARLAEQLVESLAHADGGEIRAAWASEALRRRDELRSGAVRPVAGAKVLTQARGLVGRR